MKARKQQRPSPCEWSQAIDEFRALFEEHEAEAGWGSAMASCYDMAIKSGVLPDAERVRFADWEEKAHDEDMLREAQAADEDAARDEALNQDYDRARDEILDR